MSAEGSGMSKRFAGRIFMVTGASSGLGRAICAALGREGANVLALARNEDALADTQAAVESAGGRCLAIPFDLTRYAEFPHLFDALKQQVPHLDGLVHAAGELNRCAPMRFVEATRFRRMIDINLTAPNLLTQALFPLLTQAATASVIFTTCDMAEQAQPNWHGYGLAKAALVHAAAMWQLEHPDTSIRFNAVNPGRMRTELMRRAFPGLDPMDVPPPEKAVAAFLYLLSDAARDIRGRHLSAAELDCTPA